MIEIARNVRNFLVNGTIINSVNTPSVDSKTAQLLEPYLQLAEGMGKMLSQIASKGNESLNIKYSGR